jgi:hypothetical protein
MATQLNDIIILVNDEQVAYTPDTLKWKDGFGDYNIRNAVVGGGQTEQVFSRDLSTKFGMVGFSMPTTEENEANKRTWKVNGNNNVVELVGPPGSNFSKIFTQAAIISDPESNAATDGNIEVEFNTNPAQ